MDVGNNDTPNCYGPEYVNATERSIIDYFESTVLHDLQFPTYKWLEEGGVVPSNTTGVDLRKMLDILTEKSGAIPYVSFFLQKEGGGLTTSLDVVVPAGLSCTRFGITLIPLVDLKKGESVFK